MNKNTIIAIVAIIIIGLAVMLSLNKGDKKEPTTAEQPAVTKQAAPEPVDTTSAIQNDINSIDLGDLDKEFGNIDQELQGL